MTTRPSYFEIDHSAPLASGLALACLIPQPSGRKLFDRSGHANHGTFTSTLDPNTCWAWSAALGRWVLFFPGISGEVITRVIDVGDIDLESLYSYSFWLNVAADQEWQTPFLKGEFASGNYGSLFNSNGTFRVYRSGSSRTVSPATGISGSGWRHILVSCDGTTTTTYIDGVSADSGALASPNTNDANLYIGAPGNSYQTYQLDGYLADLLIWKGVSVPASYARPLADRSNVLLEIGGRPLILPPRRRFFPAAAPFGNPWYAYAQM